MVIDGEVVVLPMMYLSYDHRLIDGKTAVQFLVAVKNLIEDQQGFCCSYDFEIRVEV